MTVLGTRLTRQIIYVIGLANTITGVNNSQDLQDLFEKVKFLKQKIIKISQIYTLSLWNSKEIIA